MYRNSLQKNEQYKDFYDLIQFYQSRMFYLEDCVKKNSYALEQFIMVRN